MKAWFFIVATANLMACSQVPDSPYVGSNQPRVVPDGLSVVVVNVHNEAEAQPWAEAYCAKRGRMAHFVQMEVFHAHRKAPTDSASFDCVPRSS